MLNRVKPSPLTIFLFLLLFALPVQAADYMTIVKDGVNVRSGPSTKSEVLWEVFRDFPVKILSSKGEWTQIKDFEGDSGWVYGPLLNSKKMTIVKVKKANLRQGPGKDYDIVATALYGVVLSPGRNDGSWRQVKHSDGTKGWVHESLVWP
ncbi:MAG: SH3 domain-containing protein [Thermodesulfobacteriota bacterium]